MKSYLLTLLVLLVFESRGQTWQGPVIPEPSYKQVDVMLLGVFHFSNPGLDTYQEVFPFDPQTPEHQDEINKVAHAIRSFNPTKIGLEFSPEMHRHIDSLYKAYVLGEYKPGSNEIYQLGFRIARLCGLKTIYGIDAKNRHYSTLRNMTEAEYQAEENRLIQIGFDKKPATRIWYPLFEKMYRYEDSLKTEMQLSEYLLFINNDKRNNIHHGIYLVDGFKLGIGEEENYFGADMRTAWYNRNLRMLQNIYRVIDNQDERVLIIVGAGHLALLKHMINLTPELNLISPIGYLSAIKN